MAKAADISPSKEKKEPKKRNLVLQIGLNNNKIFELWQNN
jgi:hypothetical protein